MVNEEVKILNRIYNIISNINGFSFDSFEYVYKLNDNEAWSSMELIYRLENNIVSKNDFDILDSYMLEDLSEELRSIMFSKTGGKWTKFILNFNDSEVTTRFEYGEQSLS